MPKVTADFSQISSSFEDLPEGDYRVGIEDIEERETKENKLPSLSFKLVVQEGEHTGRVQFDNVTLKTKEGKRNDIGYGRIKAYAEAILGAEAANSPDGIDTDELKGGTCIIVVKSRTYEQNGEQKTGTQVKKVLPVG